MAVVVGSAALALGVVVCFQGLRLLPFILPVVAFLAGAAVGAETVSLLYGIPLLSTVPSMIVAGVVGLIFVALSQPHYQTTIIALAALGGFIFASVWLTANGHAALGLSGGFALGAAAALVAALLPRVLVVSVTAALGAALVVGGVLVLGGWISVDGRGLPTAIQVPRPWVLGWIVISALGVCVQLLTSSLESTTRR